MSDNTWQDRAKKNLGELVEEWTSAVWVLLGPLPLALLATAVIMFFLVVGQNPQDEASRKVRDFLIFAISIVAAVIGGLIDSRFRRVNEEQAVLPRAKLAILNLQALADGIDYLDQRVLTYIAQTTDGRADSRMVTTYLEEVRSLCRSQIRLVSNGIEAWRDVVPGAEVTSQLAVIARLEARINELQAGLTAVPEAGSANSAEVKELNEVRGRLLRENLRRLGATGLKHSSTDGVPEETGEIPIDSGELPGPSD